jgi:hypothetical protein
MKTLSGDETLLMWDASVITHWDFMLTYGQYSRLTVCIVIPLCDICVSSVTCVTVTLSNSVFVFQ